MTPTLHRLESRMAQLREACQKKHLPVKGIAGVQNMYALNERLSGMGKEEARTLLNKSIEYFKTTRP